MSTVWKPLERTPSALILFSHFSGGTRHASTYLCAHLASHGYLVAAIDHSDTQLPRPSAALVESEKAERMQAWIDARVPDLQLLLGHVRSGHERVGVVGHSFGGWTALAAASKERNIEAIVALAPAGALSPRPGVIPAQLTFDWGRDVPTLIVAGDSDVSIPVEQVRDVYERVPSAKKLIVLRGLDHLHFADDPERRHTEIRTMTVPEELAWMQAEMRAFSELRPESEAHRLIRGLTVAHFDAQFKADDAARSLLDGFPDFA